MFSFLFKGCDECGKDDGVKLNRDFEKFKQVLTPLVIPKNSVKGAAINMFSYLDGYLGLGEIFTKKEDMISTHVKGYVNSSTIAKSDNMKFLFHTIFKCIFLDGDAYELKEFLESASEVLKDLIDFGKVQYIISTKGDPQHELNPVNKKHGRGDEFFKKPLFQRLKIVLHELHEIVESATNENYKRTIKDNVLERHISFKDLARHFFPSKDPETEFMEKELFCAFQRNAWSNKHCSSVFINYAMEHNTKISNFFLTCNIIGNLISIFTNTTVDKKPKFDVAEEFKDGIEEILLAHKKIMEIEEQEQQKKQEEEEKEMENDIEEFPQAPRREVDWLAQTITPEEQEECDKEVTEIIKPSAVIRLKVPSPVEPKRKRRKIK